jgi:hypothetical protein
MLLLILMRELQPRLVGELLLLVLYACQLNCVCVWLIIFVSLFII